MGIAILQRRNLKGLSPRARRTLPKCGCPCGCLCLAAEGIELAAGHHWLRVALLEHLETAFFLDKTLTMTEIASLVEIFLTQCRNQI